MDAVTDGLTALYNQRYIKQRLGEEVARATEIGHPLALLFCDLDHFKGYNDRRGHTAGDRALRVVSGVLLRSVRKIDLAARHSGEEFTVILMDTTPDGALEVAERIRAGVAGLDLGGPDRELTVSVGIATSPDDAALMEELVDKADWAMYLATRQGRDRVLPFGPGAHEQTSGARATKWTAPTPQAGVSPCPAGWNLLIRFLRLDSERNLHRIGEVALTEPHREPTECA